MKTLLCLFISTLALAQTITPSISYTSQRNVQVTMALSQDGFVNIEYGTTMGGPYPYLTPSFCSGGPEIVFSGTWTNPPIWYVTFISNTGVPSGPNPIFSGSGISGGLTATLRDSCIPSYPISAATWSASAATVTMIGDGCGSGAYATGQTVTISNMGAWNASNVTISSNTLGSCVFTYPLASNPGAFVAGGLATVPAGSGATVTPTVVGGVVTNVTISGGTGYHGQDYNNPFFQLDGTAAGTRYSHQSIGGLQPGLTYYAKALLRPHQSDTSGQVASSEFPWTTSAPCSGGICAPAPPSTIYEPANPANYPSFTTGYTAVPIAYDSGVGACVATSTVTATYTTSVGGSTTIYPGGPSVTSWTVTVGDRIQTILGEVGYGAKLQVAQGSPCPVPNSGPEISVSCPGSNTVSPFRFLMCTKTIDPLATSLSDPAHRVILIETVQTNPTDFPPPGTRTGPQWAPKLASFIAQQANGVQTGFSGAQCFSTDASMNIGSYSSSINPIVHHYWLRNGECSTIGTGAFSVMMTLGGNNNPFTAQYAPQYITVERWYFNLPTRVSTPPTAGFVTTMGCVSGSPGGFWSIVDSYCATADNNQQLPLGIYWTDCTAGPGSIENNYISVIGQPIYGESTGVPGCNATTPTSLATNIGSRNISDVLHLHNTIYWPRTACVLCPGATWDGLSRPNVRNPDEWKIGKRHKIVGNWFLGCWSQITDGEAVAMTPSAINVNGDSGTTDWLVSMNVMDYCALPFTFSGARSSSNPGPPEPVMTQRGLFFSNYATHAGQNLNGQALIGPVFFSSNFGGQDISVIGNAEGTTSGDTGSSGGALTPSWMTVGSGGQLLGGFTMIGNVIGASGGGVASSSPTENPGMIISIDPSCCTNFPVVPVMDTTSISTAFNTFSSAITGTGLVPAYNWKKNVIICAYFGTGYNNWTPMTDTQCTTFATSGVPTTDTYTPSNGANTIAARLANAGRPGLNTGNPNCTLTIYDSCWAGPNTQGIEDALGVVSQIAAYPGPTGVTISFRAPDSKPVSVDICTGSSPVTTCGSSSPVTRIISAGGSQQQTVTATGLSSSTCYAYVIHGYYDQTASWFSVGWDSSNLNTSGNFCTVGSGTRTVSVSFALPSGATNGVFTATPISGSPVVQTCTSSPCSLPGVAKGYYYLSQAFNNGASGGSWAQ